MKSRSSTQTKSRRPLAIYLATFNAQSPALLQATRHWAAAKLEKRRTPRPPTP